MELLHHPRRVLRRHALEGNMAIIEEEVDAVIMIGNRFIGEDRIGRRILAHVSAEIDVGTLAGTGR